MSVLATPCPPFAEVQVGAMFPHFWSRTGADTAPDAEKSGHGGGLFGRHRHGPFGGRQRGARMFDSGALRLVVLGLIAQEPRHGYDIIQAMRARFQGLLQPEPRRDLSDAAHAGRGRADRVDVLGDQTAVRSYG